MNMRILSNLEFKYLAELHLMILCQGNTNSSDSAWDAYLVELRRGLQSGEHFRSLVVTEGAYPTRSQQARMTSLVGGRTPRVAVITSSTALRFVVSILALLNKKVSCFDPRQRKAAFSHIGLTPSEQVVAEATIELLRGKMTVANTTAA